MKGHLMKTRWILLSSLMVCVTLWAVRADEPPGSNLPKVLIIGDSISIGYMKFLPDLFSGKAEVVHNPGNAQHSGFGLAHLEEWLGDTKWDVIHFNFGLHDLKYVDDEGKNAKSTAEGHIQVPLDQYRQNLEQIVARLKKTGATLIFATTTPVPKELTNAIRHSDDVPRYNEVALEVMRREKVAVNDLFAFVTPKIETLQKPKDVHFTPEGSKALAEEVARKIQATAHWSSSQPRGEPRPVLGLP